MVLILMTMKIAPENMDWQTRQGVGDRNKGWEMRSEQRFCASASAYSAVSTLSNVSTVNFCELGKGFVRLLLILPTVGVSTNKQRFFALT